MTTDVALRERSAPLAIGSLRLNGLDDLGRVAKAVAASGLFKDANTPEKVAVKMFFALTMGFSPIAGLTGVDLIEGNPTPNAHFWAAAIEDSPLYDYDVLERTNERCRIAFSRWDQRAQEWRKRGEVTWTIEDARAAKLAGKDNWTKYPRAMLWARAMTEGGRTYCPGLFGGVRAYEPDELGSPAPPSVVMGQEYEVIDPATGEVVELPFAAETPAPAAPEAPAAEGKASSGETAAPAAAPEPAPKMATRAQIVRMFAIASEAKIHEERVKQIVLNVAGVESSKEIPRAKYDAVVDALAQEALDADADHAAANPEPEDAPLDGQAVLDGLKAKHGDPDRGMDP